MKHLDRFLAVALCAGCGGKGDSGEVVGTRTFRDQGRACLTPPTGYLPGTIAWGNTGEVEIVANQPAMVWVVFEACMDPRGASTEGSCEVAVDGAVLTVTATGQYDLVSGTAPSSCYPFSVACDTPALEAGTWTLGYGAGTTEIELPYSGPPPCVSAR